MVQLIDMLGSSSFVKIFKLFSKAPEKEFYRAEIGKKTGMSKATVGKWLKTLTKKGVLERKEKENRIYYSLNTSNAFVKQLLILTAVSEIAPFFKNFEETYLYGSLARGDGTSKSDVDLLIITTKEKKEALKKVESAAKKLKRKVSAVVFTPVEFSKLSREDKPFYRRIIKDRIKLSE